MTDQQAEDITYSAQVHTHTYIQQFEHVVINQLFLP